jgi:hypothetical protein
MLYKRLIAKLGTNLLTGGISYLHSSIMSSLVEQMARLHLCHFAYSARPMLQYAPMDKKIPPRLTESVSGAG